MGPIERGLLECAANGTLSPQGRVSPLAKAYKAPGFPWGRGWGGLCGGLAQSSRPSLSTVVSALTLPQPPSFLTSHLIHFHLLLTLLHLVYDVSNIPLIDVLSPVCSRPILGSKPAPRSWEIQMWD